LLIVALSNSYLPIGPFQMFFPEITNADTIFLRLDFLKF